VLIICSCYMQYIDECELCSSNPIVGNFFLPYSASLIVNDAKDGHKMHIMERLAEVGEG
jgi:hypothetical protein